MRRCGSTTNAGGDIAEASDRSALFVGSVLCRGPGDIEHQSNLTAALGWSMIRKSVQRFSLATNA
jgi:hypothetical protein